MRCSYASRGSHAHSCAEGLRVHAAQVLDDLIEQERLQRMSPALSCCQAHRNPPSQTQGLNRCCIVGHQGHRSTYLSCASVSCEENILPLLDKVQDLPLHVKKWIKMSGESCLDASVAQCFRLIMPGVTHLLRSKLWAHGFISILQGGGCLHAPLKCRPFLAQRI